jgi:HAD superfamily hydrolase (TIGR01509 family)
MTEDELKTYVEIQEDRVIAKIRAKSQPCPGISETLATLHNLDRYILVVVSSSSFRRIRACLETAGLVQFFDDLNIFSAADSLLVPSTKPNPAVYLYALKQLGARAEECLTVEDSMSGVRAATGADLKCLGYVGSTHTPGQRTEMANHLLNAGCVEIMFHWGEYGRHLSTIEVEQHDLEETQRSLRGPNKAADI